MSIKTVLALLTILTVSLVSIAAYAFSIQEDHGTWMLIRCTDGSNARIAKSADGTWAVTQAGKNGQIGSGYAMEGKAAQAGCGE